MLTVLRSFMGLWGCVFFGGLLAECVQAEEPVASQLPAGKQWKLVWNDEFDGTQLDRTKWDYRLHIMQTRYETWTEEGAELDGQGRLLLKAYEKDGKYYTSQLQTGSNFLDRPGEQYSGKLRWPVAKIAPPKFMHKYGYYETRCMLPKQPGWWGAFWIQSPNIGATLDPRQSGVEIDIMENFTRDGVVFHNIHWNGYGADHKQGGSGPLKQPELAEGFHTFGVDWNAKNYIFYIDGKETWRYEGPVSDREEFILISAECDGYRNGGPTPALQKAKMPDFFIVDYVRVFDEVNEAAPPQK
jgi:beta-glucanase (GH16 family)